MVSSDIITPFPFQFDWLKTEVHFLMEFPQTNTTSCLENISYRRVLHLFIFLFFYWYLSGGLQQGRPWLNYQENQQNKQS